MAKFKYNALKNKTQIVSGEIEAKDYREAREKIRELGFLPTKLYSEDVIIEQGGTVELEEFKVDLPRQDVRRLSLQEKIFFTSQLETLLSSGVPIVEALNSIEINSPIMKIKIISRNLQQCVLGGMSFAGAMTTLYKDVFGPVYISLVKAGEDSGELDVTLNRMLELLRKQDNIKGKIIVASIYPAILIVMMIILLVLFTVKIFPALNSVLQFAGADAPIYSQMLAGFCDFIKQFWWLVLIGVGAFWGGISTLHKIFKKQWDSYVLGNKVSRKFVLNINLSNYMSVLHIAYDAGIPIANALELANRTVGNTFIKERLSRVIGLVRNGKSLTKAFQINGAIPPEYLSMISTGEKTGCLGKMFNNIARVLDKEVDMSFDIMMKLLEPAMLVVVSAFVLVLAFAFLQMYYAALNTIF